MVLVSLAPQHLVLLISGTEQHLIYDAERDNISQKKHQLFTLKKVSGSFQGMSGFIPWTLQMGRGYFKEETGLRDGTSPTTYRSVTYLNQAIQTSVCHESGASLHPLAAAQQERHKFGSFWGAAHWYLGPVVCVAIN